MADPATDAQVIRCHGITKRFGSGNAAVLALRGADLEVLAGEMLLLAGPSGCGKTTLLSIIGTMLDRDTGECEVMGRDPGAMSAVERAGFRNSSLGFVFQSFNLLPTLTAADNVAVPLLIAGVPRRRAESRAAELLDSVGLDERHDALPAQLSGGQQQRVAIARALAREPPLILCDEPTSNLDLETGLQMFELLRQATRPSGRALVVATHDTRVFAYADRIARMEDGRILEITRMNGAAGSRVN